MTSTITYDSLEKKAYDNLYELLDDRTNIPDPRNRSKSERFVYDYDPLDSITTSVRASDFPHIILFPLSSLTQSNESVNGTKKRYSWMTRIIVRAVRRGASGADRSLGRNDLNTISDSLHKFFNTLSDRNALSDIRMRNVRFNKVASDVGVIDGSTEFVESEFELGFSVRMGVVA